MCAYKTLSIEPKFSISIEPMGPFVCHVFSRVQNIFEKRKEENLSICIGTFIGSTTYYTLWTTSNSSSLSLLLVLFRIHPARICFVFLYVHLVVSRIEFHADSLESHSLLWRNKKKKKIIHLSLSICTTLNIHCKL